MRSHDKKKKNKKASLSHLADLNFFAEAGLLKKVKRSGWWVAGIKDPESVAEHSFRCAIMAHYIALLENADPYRVVMMALFNDIHEARINDLHKMGHYYIDFKAAEKKVFADQVDKLDGKVKRELISLRQEYDAQQTKESLIARDADILECLLQAKEYYQSGHLKAKIFLTRAPEFLRAKSSRKIWKKLCRWDSALWWQNVVKFER
jgi:putative hydrolase of HD superfamily